MDRWAGLLGLLAATSLHRQELGWRSQAGAHFSRLLALPSPNQGQRGYLKLQGQFGRNVLARSYKNKK